jgi:hypothetical protein
MFSTADSLEIKLKVIVVCISSGNRNLVHGLMDSDRFRGPILSGGWWEDYQ